MSEDFIWGVLVGWLLTGVAFYFLIRWRAISLLDLCQYELIVTRAGDPGPPLWRVRFSELKRLCDWEGGTGGMIHNGVYVNIVRTLL
jgi:hypothetical protein